MTKRQLADSIRMDGWMDGFENFIYSWYGKEAAPMSIYVLIKCLV
jgi:hypothetical protein